MAVEDPMVEIVRCKYCSSLTVLMGGMAQCPRGCPGNFAIMYKVRVPREGVVAALADSEEE